MKARPVTIQGLLIVMVALMLIAVFAIEAFYIEGYRQTLASGAQTLMSAKIDQLFIDIRSLWHGLTLLSSTISRSDAMREFVLSAQPCDERVIKNLNASVSLVQLASSGVVSLMVTDLNGFNLYAYRSEDLAVLEHARNAIAQGLVIKSPVHLQMGRGGQAVTYCINCTDPRPGGQPLYTVLVYNLDSLRQTLSAMADTAMSILLLDGNDEAVMANRAHTPEEVEELLRMMHDSATVRRQVMQVRRLPLLRWQLVAALDPAAEAVRMQPVWRFALWTNLFLLVGLTAFFLVLRMQIDTPVRRMLQYMRRVTVGQTHARLELGMRNELSAIQDGMNDMLDRLEEMTRRNQRAQERLFELRLSQTKAEIAALTSQINPHFLFNTLDCMRGIAATGGGEQLETAIDALAAIFRHTTRGAPDVPLAEEMRVIERYMAIVHIRHGGRIGMHSRVSPQAADCLIPKMILQPLVENAVVHGLEAVSRKGLLTIDARVEDDMLVIVVEDDGRGVSEAELEHLRETLEGGRGRGRAHRPVQHPQASAPALRLPVRPDPQSARRQRHAGRGAHPGLAIASRADRQGGLKMYTVFLVDDEPWAMESLLHVLDLSAHGFMLAGRFTDGSQAWAALERQPPDVAFIDIRMPDLDGLTIARKAAQRGLSTLFVIVSGHGEFAYAQEAIRSGVCDYCLKPLERRDAERLMENLRQKLNAARAAANAALCEEVMSGTGADRLFESQGIAARDTHWQVVIFRFVATDVFQDIRAAFAPFPHLLFWLGSTKLVVIVHGDEALAKRIEAICSGLAQAHPRLLTGVSRPTRHAEHLLSRISQAQARTPEVLNEIKRVTEPEELRAFLSDLSSMVAYLRALMEQYLSESTPCMTVVNESFLEMLEYVRQHCCERLRLADLAERFHLNMAYTSELFHKVVGMTYTDYLTRLRMERAQAMISAGNDTLTEIALSTGYGDYFTFSKRFKQYYGISPSQAAQRK